MRVEGTYVGRLDGLRFVPDESSDGDAMRTLITAANRVLRGEVALRARRLPGPRHRQRARGPEAERGRQRGGGLRI